MPPRVPSYLKGLAETRATAAGDVARYRQLHEEIGQKLHDAERVLAATDLLVRKFDSRLDPTQIAPVFRRERYGKRGALKAAILDYLAAAGGEAVTTTELAIALMAKFGLEFADRAQARRWVHSVMGKALCEMARAGEIERLHGLEATGEVGRWRLATGASLSDLKALAEGQGVTVASHESKADPDA